MNTFWTEYSKKDTPPVPFNKALYSIAAMWALRESTIIAAKTQERLSVSYAQDMMATAPFETPISILCAQSKLLSQKTKGALEGGVFLDSIPNCLLAYLYICLPERKDLQYHICMGAMSPDIYPCVLVDQLTNTTVECYDEPDFISKLKTVLQSPATVRALSLMRIHALDRPNTEGAQLWL